MNPSIQDQIEFYNGYWKYLKPFSSYKIHRLGKILAYLNQIRRELKEVKILDLGCGDGRCVAIWNEIGPASGVDLSTNAISYAKKRYPFLHFESCDATNTSFPPNSFDVIISQEVIEHILDQKSYLDECKRLLKPNGYLIITTPNKFYFDRVIGGNYSRQPIENLLSPKELKRLVIDNFKIKIFETIIYAKGHFGIYRFISNRVVIGLLEKSGLDFLRKRIMQKFLLGLQICLVVQKK